MDIKSIYYDIGHAMKGLCDKIYAHSRPKAVEQRIDSYIVVDIPYSIKNEEMDFEGRYNDYTTTVQIEVFVRDVMSSKNPNEFNIANMSETVKDVMNMFPIVTDNIIARRPIVTMQAQDGDGFSVAIIQVEVRTK